MAAHKHLPVRFLAVVGIVVVLVTFYFLYVDSMNDTETLSLPLIRISLEQSERYGHNRKFDLVDSSSTEQQKHKPSLNDFTLNKSSHHEFELVDSFSAEQPKLRESVRLLFFVPRALNKNSVDNKTDALSKRDQESIQHLAQFLDYFISYDAATCLQEKMEKMLFQEGNSSWCRFATRNSTLFVRNTGPWHVLLSNASVQLCNIIRGAFLIRKKEFVNLGWRSRYGKASIFDFFLRSKGKLRIARLNDCLLSDKLSVIDRGPELEDVHDFPDYSRFGNSHGILRIVTESRVEWTKCAADGRVCPEKPLVIRPNTLPPTVVCCSVVLDRILRDLVWALNKAGIKYRLVYATVVGAVRSGTIIPWTQDVDVTLITGFQRHWNWKIQHFLQGKYYVGPSFVGTNRMIPLIPPHMDLNTRPFFDGPDDVSGEHFFSEDILSAMEGVHVIGNTWKERGYADFYNAERQDWWTDHSIVTINGRNYTTVKNITRHLTKWYGHDYMTREQRSNWTGLH